MELKAILAKAIELNASDVHLSVGLAPILRKNTELSELDFPTITDDIINEMLISMVGAERFNRFKEQKELDFSTSINSSETGYEARFRGNAHYQRNKIALSLRVIPNTVPSIEELHLPGIVKELTDLPRGLVLVTGHTGSGKTTTLAAMIGLINEKYRKRIITLEDPIEYDMDNKLSMIEQREIGIDCLGFALGLRQTLRQDPDIIMVGEMRDLDTTSSAITAAETGHLVLSTLHTINGPQTIERIIDIYPAKQQNQIRTMLANTLQAIVSQTLFRRIDKPGMVPCAEIVLCNSAVRNCIRENRIYEIPNIIETSRKQGMQSMDKSIEDMYATGYIDRQEAVLHSSNPAKMNKILSRIRSGEILQPVS